MILISSLNLPLRQHISTKIAETRYESIFEAGLLYSKYHCLFSRITIGILTLSPLLPSPKENFYILEVSCLPVIVLLLFSLQSCKCALLAISNFSK